MMKSSKKSHILTVVSLACLFAALIFVSLNPTAAQASPPLRQDSVSETCAECHADIQQAWSEGAHSSSRTTHVLDESMNCLACHPEFQGGQGIQPPAGFASNSDGKMQDADCVVCHTTGYDPMTGTSASYGVTCEACHTPVADHPNKDIATNTKSDLCGRCHSDSRFNWDNWQNSRHYRENMNCVECHDPHSAALHNVASEPTADKSALCISCHEPDEHMSPYSTHGRAGVSCADCHLGEKRGVDTFHIVPNHSFKPEIETCSSCHAATLHRPAMPSADLPAAPDLRPKPTADAAPDSGVDKDAPISERQPVEDQRWWLALLAIAGLTGVMVGAAVPLAAATLKNKKSRQTTL